MNITPEIRSLFGTLIRNPRDWTLMKVLADAFEEAGEYDVAEAYRWAARNEKWPFVKKMMSDRALCHPSSHYLGHYYDWDSLAENKRNNGIKEESRLVPALHKAIVYLDPEWKRYGGVHRAFLLLAKGIVKLRREQPIAWMQLA